MRQWNRLIYNQLSSFAGNYVAKIQGKHSFLTRMGSKQIKMAKPNDTSLFFLLKIDDSSLINRLHLLQTQKLRLPPNLWRKKEQQRTSAFW